jgi:Transcription factor WhiB
VPHLHQPYETQRDRTDFDAEPAPLTFITAMDKAMPWRLQAACAGDERTWVIEPRGEKLSPASILWRLEICAGCPVRVECLTFSYSTPEESVGIWGGTSSNERRQTLTNMTLNWLGTGRKAAVAEAVALLEASLPERLEGWRVRAAAKLAERSLKRFPRTQAWHLHGPGPGRGHRGPVALLAAELGVSRSTAWRRLRAAA